MAALERGVAAREREIADLKELEAELEARDKELAALRAQTQLEADETVKVPKQRLLLLEQELDASREHIQAYKKTIRELELAVEDVKRERDAAQTNVAALEQAYKKAVREFELSVEDVKRERDAAQANAAALGQRAKELEVAIQDVWRVEVERLNKDLGVANALPQELEGANKDLAEQLRVLVSERSEFEAANRDLKQRIAGLEAGPCEREDLEW